jgi:hypothetical protein
MIKAATLLFIATIIGLALLAGSNYSGSLPVYLLFTLVGNALFFNGLRRRALFFDTFIGIFLWLGFWLKFSVRTALGQAAFLDAVAFDRSPAAYDHALIVSSCGLAALLVASLVRERFFVYPEQTPSCNQSGLFLLYQRYRRVCITLFLATVILVAISNVWLGIYQRGVVAQTVLPFGLSGVYKWLLQFGLASISALIIRFELELNRNITLLSVVPALMEALFSNVSLLSRGMILNAAGLGFGTIRQLSSMKIRPGLVRIAAVVIAFAVLFVISVLTVNYLRATSYGSSPEIVSRLLHNRELPTGQYGKTAVALQHMTVPLFIDRWVGIEAVVAVASSKDLGWDLWRDAWNERFQVGVLTIYDQRFIESPYRANADKPVFHFISLPGIIAFLYFPGSLAFLFAALLLCGWLGAAVEMATYRYAGQNWILCSLIAQVVAYRYAHFGYVPAQSYLLFGTVILNIALLYAADRILRRYFSVPAVVAR